MKKLLFLLLCMCCFFGSGCWDTPQKVYAGIKAKYPNSKILKSLDPELCGRGLDDGVFCIADYRGSGVVEIVKIIVNYTTETIREIKFNEINPMAVEYGEDILL